MTNRLKFLKERITTIANREFKNNKQKRINSTKKVNPEYD
jgi:hypothetical protein